MASSGFSPKLLGAAVKACLARVSRAPGPSQQRQGGHCQLETIDKEIAMENRKADIDYFRALAVAMLRRSVFWRQSSRLAISASNSVGSGIAIPPIMALSCA
jgi:hypothetical protein